MISHRTDVDLRAGGRFRLLHVRIGRRRQHLHVAVRRLPEDDRPGAHLGARLLRLRPHLQSPVSGVRGHPQRPTQYVIHCYSHHYDPKKLIGKQKKNCSGKSTLKGSVCRGSNAH